jgi:hypothetical protein
MTSTTVSAHVHRADPRTLITGGIKLGLLTVAGVVVFALLSRAMSGTLEVIVQSVIILAGGVLAAYLPALWVQPREIDGIGWSCLLAVIGAVTFAFVDTVLLRPLDLYHWTWDAVGGGSGWWYLPVWFMGAAFLAWLGALVYTVRARRDPAPALAGLAGQTVAVAVVVFALLAVTGIAPFHAATAALAAGLAMVIQVPVAAALGRR